MRRIALGLAGAAILVAVLGVTLAPRVSADEAGERLLAALGEATGLEVLANGRSSISFFPSPKVRIDGVSVATRGEAPFAVAREVTGSLRLPPLLAGRVELGEVTLSEPEIAVDRLPYGDGIARLRARSLDGAAPEIRIADGRLRWGARVVDRVEASLFWPSEGGPLAISGYGRFAGKPVEATVQLADLSAYIRRESSPIRARVEGGGARLMFDGEAVDAEGPKFAGEISARAASLGGALAWLGVRDDKQGADWTVSFAGRGAIDAAGLSISNAEVDLAGEPLLGAGRFALAAGGTPAIEATLDAETLDLGPYATALAPELLRKDGRWSADAIDLGGLDGWTLDLRLSAQKVRLGALKLGATAATLAVARGGLDLSIGEATAYGGALGGRLVLEPAGASARVKIEGGATDVAIHEALSGFLSKAPIAGALTADFAVESAGASIGEIVAGLKGRASARLVDGALENAGRSRTLSLAGIRGRIDVSTAQGHTTIERGVARADDVTIDGPDAAFALSGVASLVDREVRLSGSVKPAGMSWTLPVTVEGPLAAPRLRPDLAGKRPRGEARRDEGGAAVP